jgi:hypothetical protein
VPGLCIEEAQVQVLECAGYFAVAVFALNQGNGLGVMQNHKIYLAAIYIAKIAQFQRLALGVDLVFHPLKQVTVH